MVPSGDVGEPERGVPLDRLGVVRGLAGVAVVGAITFIGSDGLVWFEQHGPRSGASRRRSHRWITTSQHERAPATEGGALRVLFAFDPRRQAILLLGGD